MEDMELWSVYTSQVVALAAIVGATLGMLRKREILGADAVDAAFRLADKHLPDTARPAGSNLLAHMRMMAEVVAGDDEGGRPRR